MPSPETIVLRDEDGREHRAIARSDDEIVVGDSVLHVSTAADGSLRVSGAGNAIAWSAVVGDVLWVFVNGHVFTFEVAEIEGRRRRVNARDLGALTAPMPATVRRIEVKPGDSVRQGDVLILLEAMKMELPVRSPADGVVRRLNCREGEMVQAGQELVEVGP